MMEGKFREYSVKDIERLIYRDAGLESELDQRQKGEIWYCGNFEPPKNTDEVCMRVKVYALPFQERLENHVAQKGGE